MTASDAGNFPAAKDLAFRGYLRRAEQLLEDDSEGSRWLRSYLDAARGRFAAALRGARPLAHGAVDQELRAAANRTVGSVLRQCGRHREARPFDVQALGGARSAAERAHALIGLAADSIGIGAPVMCRRALAEATAVAPEGDWRVRVRLDWVRTERALLAGDPRAARWAAWDAARTARAAGAHRHVAKSLLFLGVSQWAAGDSRARESLREAARIACGLGAMPIARVARTLLDEDAAETFPDRSVG